MAATFEWAESNGTPETVTVLGSIGSKLLGWAFKTEDSSGTQNYTTKTVVAGSYSYEKYLRGKFTNSFNTVNNLQYWKSAGSLAADGVIDLYSGTTITYAIPGTGASATADGTIGTADPASSNVPGSLSGIGYSGYIVQQARASTVAVAGDSGTARTALSYDET